MYVVKLLFSDRLIDSDQWDYQGFESLEEAQEYIKAFGEQGQPIYNVSIFKAEKIA